MGFEQRYGGKIMHELLQKVNEFIGHGHSVVSLIYADKVVFVHRYLGLSNPNSPETGKFLRGGVEEDLDLVDTDGAMRLTIKKQDG